VRVLPYIVHPDIFFPFLFFFFFACVGEVQAAQHVIERNTGRVDKRMLSSKPSGALVHLHQVCDH